MSAMTIGEALAYLRDRFGVARAEPLQDRGGNVVGCTFRVDRSKFFTIGPNVDEGRLYLFADSVGYARRKAEERLERKRRAAQRPLTWLAGGNKPDALGYVEIDPDRWQALRRSMEEGQ